MQNRHLLKRRVREFRESFRRDRSREFFSTGYLQPWVFLGEQWWQLLKPLRVVFWCIVDTILINFLHFFWRKKWWNLDNKTVYFKQVDGNTEVKWSVTKFSTFDASSSLLTRCSTYTSCFDWRTAPLYKHCMLEIRMANKKVPSNHQRDLWYPLVFMFSFICDLDNIHHLPTYISQ